MSIRALGIIGATSFVALALPLTASAANFALTVNSPAATANNIFTVQPSDTVTVSLEAKRSYACTGIPTSSVSEFAFSDSVSDPDTNPITARKCGDISPRVTVESGADASVDDNRVCFTTAVAGTHTITIDDAVGGGEAVRLECVETTLYGGFNTNVNDFNFLELENVSNAAIVAKVTAKDNAGTTLLNASSQSLAVGTRFDVDIHTSAGTDVYGPIIVTHDGPLGAIQGRTSFYTGTVSNFLLNGNQPLQTREKTY